MPRLFLPVFGPYAYLDEQSKCQQHSLCYTTLQFWHYANEYVKFPVTDVIPGDRETLLLKVGVTLWCQSTDLS